MSKRLACSRLARLVYRLLAPHDSLARSTLHESQTALPRMERRPLRHRPLIAATLDFS
jgi:hypothetical protein